jgi:threonine dehydrogenase-like Zn-dependent dehydrogenase
MKIKIKCPDCRTGYYQYCSTNPPIYVCSNYGRGCCKGVSKEEYEELAKQIMPKMSLYEIQQVIYDIVKVKQKRINEFKKESGKDKINIDIAFG